MCNLYRLDRSAGEVAAFFREIALEVAGAPANLPALVYPGYPGLVVTGRAVQPMHWGFPLARTGAKGQPLKPKPVNNARADKLASPFWAASFRERRCLIPMDGFAEAEGPRGSMTRTWFEAGDGGLLVAAGLWRQCPEWGAVFTMVMTGACAAMDGVHDRMPVLLAPHQWQGWLGGEAAAALDLCRPYAGALTIRRTPEPWAAWR